MHRFIFFGLMIFVSQVGLLEKGVRTKISKKEKHRFIQEALRRMEKENSKYYGRAKALAEHWSKEKDNRSWKEAYGLVQKAAAVKGGGVKSAVTITAIDARGREVKGLPIKFRYTGARKARTAKNPTKCTEEMPIAFYHIWVEQNGNALSSEIAIFTIVKEKERVTLQLGK